MQAIEPGKKYGECTVGTFPKISIDPRIEVRDSHDRRPAATIFPYADNDHNAAMAFLAAQAIYQKMQPAFLYIEVIKISFYWNCNFAGEPLYIRANVVIVDPLLEKKTRAEAEEEICIRKSSDPIDTDDDRIVTSLVRKIVASAREQIIVFKSDRDQKKRVLKHFDSLFESEESAPIVS